MDRLLGNFASDFPKCDVDRGKAIDEGAAAPEDVELLLQIEHELTNLRCIPADAFGGKHAVDLGLYGWNGCKAGMFRPTDNPRCRW